MPALISLLVGAFMRFAGVALMRVLGWLGFTAVTFVGTSSLINLLKDSINDLAAQWPAIAVQIVGLLKIDYALSIILSAYAFRIARTFGGSGVRRLVSGILRR